MTKSCQIKWLGQVEYATAWKLQKELTAQRAAEQIPDTLLLLEHPSTYTIGIDGHREQLLLNQDELSRQNIAFYEVDRGGAIIYHGPGQLVAYPILNLRQHGHNYHTYIDLLARVIIHTLASFKVRAFRERGQSRLLTFYNRPSDPASPWSKVDSGAAVIATIGIKVDQYQITSHGFYLNVKPDLSYFESIIPPDLQGCSTTSLQQVLNKPLKIGSVLEPVIQSFCYIFNLSPVGSTWAASIALPEREYAAAR